jgi:DnaJ-class molecular chaperone
MSGPGDRPLLVLDRQGEGRVAVLLSDHIWLWARGYEGGGPHLDLLRRLSHWLMKEPDLEEESLRMTVRGRDLTVQRQTMADTVNPVTVTSPSGATRTITLESDGASERARTYDVKIPPGTTHGSTIRLRGQGGPGLGGGPPGDLLLHIEIRPHARFTVQDHDLSTLLPISPWEAALGAKIGIRTLDGGEALLAVPPGSSSGKKLRMRRMGLPLGGSERGDLIVELRIVVPESLSEAERRVFEELAKASKFEPRKG